MAKLYAEMTSHGNMRTLKRADDTRIVIDAYHKNVFLGSFEMYHVHENDTINVLWRPHGKGCGSETHLIMESQNR